LEPDPIKTSSATSSTGREASIPWIERRAA